MVLILLNLILDNQKKIRIETENNTLEKMDIEAANQKLKQQLQSIFFNILNNIDLLILTNPQKASESLVTLSEIMRYMLYDARKPMVLLQNEITHYRNIIKLQSLRLKHTERIKFDVDIQNGNVEIAPLLFLPFIENTFKFASFEGEGTAIGMTLNSIENRIEFNCRNYFRTDDPTMKRKPGGIGLSNMRRRLDLLYKGQYNLSITDENSCFVAQLTIELYLYCRR